MDGGGGFKRKDNSLKVETSYLNLQRFVARLYHSDFSMFRYIDNMSLSYENEIQDNLPLDRIIQKAITIFDIFAAHRNDYLPEKLSQKLSQPHVPINCNR